MQKLCPLWWLPRTLWWLCSQVRHSTDWTAFFNMTPANTFNSQMKHCISKQTAQLISHGQTKFHQPHLCAHAGGHADVAYKMQRSSPTCSSNFAFPHCTIAQPGHLQAAGRQQRPKSADVGGHAGKRQASSSSAGLQSSSLCECPRFAGRQQV